MNFRSNEFIGEFGKDDCEALRLLVRHILKPGCIIVEIGSWFGNGSSKVIIEELLNVDDARLYCIDTWKGSSNVAHHQKIVLEYDVYEIFSNNIIAQGGERIVYPLKMTSKEASKLINNESVDLIFIDGDHSYKSVVEDISLWKPKLRKGGILCGHDCECRPFGPLRELIYNSLDLDHIPGNNEVPFLVIHPGVVAAVDELFNGSANLWAEMPFITTNGDIYRATLWDNLENSILPKTDIPKLSKPVSQPLLISEIFSHNIVLFNAIYYGIPQSLGDIDLSATDLCKVFPFIKPCSSYEDAIFSVIEKQLLHRELEIENIMSCVKEIEVRLLQFDNKFESINESLRNLEIALNTSLIYRIQIYLKAIYYFIFRK